MGWCRMTPLSGELRREVVATIFRRGAAVIMVTAWFVFFRPQLLGGPASYIIVSGTSMEPTLREGDLAVLVDAPKYNTGDVIVFRAYDSLVIHRVVGESPRGFIVQGDNKESPDVWQPSHDEILGKMWLNIPAAGSIVTWSRRPLVLGSIAGLIGFLLVVSPPTKKRRTQSKAQIPRLTPNPIPISSLSVFPSGLWRVSGMTPAIMSLCERLLDSVGRPGSSRIGLDKWKRALSPRLLMGAAKQSGQVALLHELPTGSEVYLTGDRPPFHLRVVTTSEQKDGT